MKIIANRSVKGLSRVSAKAELISWFNTMSFARHLDLSLSVYGESILITLQNFIVILFIYYYDAGVASAEKVLFLGLFALYATILLQDEIMTETHWRLVSGTVMLSSAIARGSQFLENWRKNSTGQVAAGTVFITFFISFSRTMIVLRESDVLMYRAQYLFGFTMVSIVTL